MLISNEWLKDYVNVDQSVQALAERLQELELKSMILLTIQKILKISSWTCLVEDATSRC